MNANTARRIASLEARSPRATGDADLALLTDAEFAVLYVVVGALADDPDCRRRSDEVSSLAAAAGIPLRADSWPLIGEEVLDALYRRHWAAAPPSALAAPSRAIQQARSCVEAPQ